MADDKTFHRTFFLAGPVGRLEATLWTSTAAQNAFAGLVCHPHPLFGGTMHNKVVFQAARALRRLGLPVLRFNFRGAGLSEGAHDKGRGERDDVRAALDFLAEEYRGARVVLAGFSFGASVGLRVGCADSRVVALVGMGLPVNEADLSFLAAPGRCEKPCLFVQGTNDQFGSKERVAALVEKMSSPKELVFIEGVDHFFTGKLDEVGAAISKWMKENVLRAPRPAPEG